MSPERIALTEEPDITPRDDIEIIGHRGVMGEMPQNTLPSFRKAIEAGVPAIELDVELAKTGEVVIFHDDEVDKVTEGREHGSVNSFTFDELRAMNVNDGFEDGNTYQIPTLSEVLDVVDEYATEGKARTKVNIELKGANTAAPVSEIVRTYLEKGWKPSDFVVSSFRHDELAKFKEIFPDIDIAVLIDDKQWQQLGSAEAAVDLATSMKAVAVNPGIAFVSQELVDKAHAAGLKVNVWTVNTPEELQYLKDLSADGAFVNRLGLHRTSELEKPQEMLTTLEVLKQRKESGYVRGSRSDGKCVAIALGPGGWAGEVSIGEYLELERAGLADYADLIIGSSVGGLIATYMASKQFRDGLDVFLKFMPEHGRIPKMESLMDAVFKEYPIQFDKLPKDLPIVIALTDLDKFGTRLVRSDEVDPVEFEELTIRACHQAYVGGKPPVLKGEVMKGTRVSDSALSLPNTPRLAELISDQYPDLRITHLLSLENIRQAKNTPVNRVMAGAMNRPLDAYIRHYDPAADPEDVFIASLSGGQFSDIRAYKKEFEGSSIGDVFTTKSDKGHEIVVERVYPADLENLPGLFMLNVKEKGKRKLRIGYDAGRIAMLERTSPGLDLTTPSRRR